MLQCKNIVQLNIENICENIFSCHENVTVQKWNFSAKLNPLLLYHSEPLFMWKIQTLNFIALWFISACLLLFCVLLQTNSARSCKPCEATVLDENVSGQHYTSYSWTTQQFCSGACSVGCFWSLLALHDLMWFTVTLYQNQNQNLLRRHPNWNETLWASW